MVSQLTESNPPRGNGRQMHYRLGLYNEPVECLKFPPATTDWMRRSPEQSLATAEFKESQFTMFSVGTQTKFDLDFDTV